ncbi:hypothetical protein C8J57DRAFT_1557899 [Mycena rebaudengoi]|nr:hypothetical protein C8J57DRAFT_1557899 [Mycena rebaudengoi]
MARSHNCAPRQLPRSGAEASLPSVPTSHPPTYRVPLHGHTPWNSLNSADLVVPNQDAWRLMWDFQTLRELVDTLPENTPCQSQWTPVGSPKRLRQHPIALLPLPLWPPRLVQAVLAPLVIDDDADLFRCSKANGHL